MRSEVKQDQQPDGGAGPSESACSAGLCIYEWTSQSEKKNALCPVESPSLCQLSLRPLAALLGSIRFCAGNTKHVLKQFSCTSNSLWNVCSPHLWEKRCGSRGALWCKFQQDTRKHVRLRLLEGYCVFSWTVMHRKNGSAFLDPHVWFWEPVDVIVYGVWRFARIKIQFL